jgi:hypothetical protein
MWLDTVSRGACASGVEDQAIDLLLNLGDLVQEIRQLSIHVVELRHHRVQEVVFVERASKPSESLQTELPGWSAMAGRTSRPAFPAPSTHPCHAGLAWPFHVWLL